VFKQNPFGHYLFIKRWLIRLLGIITRRRFNGFNDLHIRGSSIIRDLPEKNVLFISNHQTYFADVTAMFHVFFASLAGRDDNLNYLRYIWRPKLNVYYIAAKETMKSGLLPRILAYTGSISIERTWREKGKSINRQVKMSDITNIGKALDDGWVITFPQGTTKPFAPVRKGTLHIIKTYNPIVVPIVIDGFRRSFDKKGIFIKKKGIKQSMHIKKPMVFDLNKSNEDLVKQIAEAIEQVPKK
jgi:1-acyl-sn-glycerol-3-phosphate acyltransferase